MGTFLISTLFRGADQQSRDAWRFHYRSPRYLAEIVQSFVTGPACKILNILIRSDARVMLTPHAGIPDPWNVEMSSSADLVHRNRPLYIRTYEPHSRFVSLSVIIVIIVQENNSPANLSTSDMT